MIFRLGINYWPVSSAMYWWRHFDATEVAQDFARIRAAGFDTVRFFLLDEAVHERSFGLWHHDYSAKPALAEVKQLADSERCAWHGTQDWLDIATDEFYTNPQAHLHRLYQRFRRHYGEEECG
jgi:endo-1,4-beta-mannosidase